MSGDTLFPDFVNSEPDLDPYGNPWDFSNNNPMDQAYGSGLYGPGLNDPLAQNTLGNSQNRNYAAQSADIHGVDMNVNPQDIMADMNGNTTQAYPAISPDLTPPWTQLQNRSGGSSSPKFMPSSDDAPMNTGFAASGGNQQTFSADLPSSPPGITAANEGWPGWASSEYRSQQPTAATPEPNRYPAAPKSFAPNYHFDWDQTKQLSFAPASNNVPAPVPPNMTYNAMPMTTGASSSGGYAPIAPMPQTTGKFGTTHAPPTKRAPQTRKPAPKKVEKKSTNKGKQAAVRFPIFTNQLMISTLAEAQDTAIERIQLNVIDDDRDDVAAHPEIWLPRITQAFDVTIKDLPDDAEKFTPEAHTEFRRWQEEHLNKVYGIFNEHGTTKAPKFAQACAKLFLEVVLESHQKGLQHVAKTIANGGANLKMKCSERIKSSIKALGDYSIVRYDFLKQDRFDGLAASPEGFVRRKVENMFVNYRKKKGKGPVRIEEIEGTKTKGTKKSKADPVEVNDNNEEDEDEVDHDAEDATNEEAKRPRKRPRGASGRK